MFHLAPQVRLRLCSQCVPLRTQVRGLNWEGRHVQLDDVDILTNQTPNKQHSFHSVSIKGASIFDYELKVVQVPPTFWFQVEKNRKNSRSWTWKTQLPSYNSTHHSTHRTHCVTSSCTKRCISYLCSIPGGRDWLWRSDIRLRQPKVELCFQLLLATASFIWTAGTYGQKTKQMGKHSYLWHAAIPGFTAALRLSLEP